MHLTETQLRILEELARYKYLTSSQMVRLGLATVRNNIYRAVKPICGPKKPIDKKNFSPIPGVGKLESVYYLRPSGADILVQELDYSKEKIRLHKGSFFGRDYMHRVRTIDFHLSWNGFSRIRRLFPLTLCTYFDFQGANHSSSGGRLQSKARIPVTGHHSEYIVPDMVIRAKQNNGREMFFLFEMADGHDTAYILRQAFGHVLALSQGTPSKAFQTSVSPRILYVFEHKSTLRAVAQRFLEDDRFSEFNEWFLLGLHESVIRNMQGSWYHCNQTKASLLL